MPKNKLFDDECEEEVSLKTENEYAKKYDIWREKEEIHKLEQKYGPNALNADAISSDNEDESDEPVEVSEEVEAQFLKTLALLKTKDPRIYDPSYKFFEDKPKQEVKETKKNTLTFMDSDTDGDGDGDGDGNIFSVEKNTDIVDDTLSPETHTTGKDEKLKDYLTGKVEHIDDPAEKDLEPLKALWSDPKLKEEEAFLRDYILNKKYLEAGDGDGDRLRDDEELEADELRVEEQAHFERAYNFRFEEPDHEYLKRFPRTMNYIRPKDERRSRKRAEVRDRKEEKKRQRLEEVARLKALKLKEIQEKIAKIKEVTGNDELAFKEEDIEGDFDPAEHDTRMRAMFDDRYYSAPAGEHKPAFPELDHHLEIENWDKFVREQRGEQRGEQLARDRDHGDELHCEHEHFNMDADYEPKKARADLLQQIQSTLGNKRRSRKKKSTLARLLATDKPVYIPDVGGGGGTYDRHMEEYYSMECEDVVGDLPTRFKYRQVVPNDYGLTVEEILLADDRELTQWVPLKRLVKHRPESVQRGEITTYRQRAADLALKKKILPSLFRELPEEPELVVPKESKKKKNKREKKRKEVKDKEDKEVKDTDDKEVNDTEKNEPNTDASTELNNETNASKKEQEHKHSAEDTKDENGAVENINADEIIDKNTALFKSKGKKHKIVNAVENGENFGNSEFSSDTAERKNKTNAVSPNGLKSSKQDPELEDHKELKTTDNYKLNQEVNVIVKESNKKAKKKNGGFQIENVLNETPSQESGGKPKPGYNLKRKADAKQSQTPNKQAKRYNHSSLRNSNNKNCSKVYYKNNVNNSSDPGDPLRKLSDERLKAYGLNPKKYRSFLKYKKF